MHVTFIFKVNFIFEGNLVLIGIFVEVILLEYFASSMTQSSGVEIINTYEHKVLLVLTNNHNICHFHHHHPCVSDRYRRIMLLDNWIITVSFSAYVFTHL